MAEDSQDKISAFDALFTNNHIQMLKILLAYVNPALLQNMAIYIKLSELRYTLHLFQSVSPENKITFPVKEAFDTDKLCHEFLPLCTEQEKKRLLHMKQIMDQLKNMQDMMEMMEMMKVLFPNENPFGCPTDSGNDDQPFTGSFNPMDFLSGYPDLQGFFQNFTHFSDTSANNSDS